MSRSRLSCRQCRASLGQLNASGIFHRAPGVTITFVDLAGGTATLKCPCGATMQFTGRAIDMGG